MKHSFDLGIVRFIVGTALLSLPAVGFAYIGPGAGLTMIGALWSVILAVVFILGGLLLWPIRTLLRRRRARPEPPVADSGIGGASAAVETPVHKDAVDR